MTLDSDLIGRPAAGTDAGLIGQFEAQAKASADRTALILEGSSVSYATLNAAANRYARLFAARTANPGDRVALLLDPGPDQFAAMIGILKAARIAVILDPKEPPDRLRAMIDDAEPALLLAGKSLRGMAEKTAGNAAIAVAGDEAPHAPLDLRLAITPGTTAILVYTSGSTGRPKAVMKPHGQLLLQPAGARRAMGVNEADRILMMASLSGGQGVNTTWSALVNGATLVPFPAAERGVTGLDRSLTGNGVTMYVSSAGIFRAFAKTIAGTATFPRVRLVLLAGDAATWDDYRSTRAIFPNASLATLFAASETGNIALSMLGPGQQSHDGPLPVGRPVTERHVRIVDEAGKALSPGTLGRVEIGGPFLAGGYWRDPEQTTAAFRVAADGARVFRSSDLGLVDADGSLVLKGRADAAVKIRGYRVDMTEVETALAGLPGVSAAAAAVVDGANRESRLIGYVVPADPTVNERRLRTVARATMARHLIPSNFVILDALPTSANGKIDRARLRNIETKHPAEHQPADPPSTPMEHLLARLWAEAFDLTDVGALDDFFMLGGDSLIATEIAALVDAETGYRMNLGTFGDVPILRDMAALIDRQNLQEAPDDVPIVRAPRDRPIPLSLSQQWMWKDAQARPRAKRFNMGSLIELNGPLDAAALSAALDFVVARHESLRTSFVPVDGEPTQSIAPPAPVLLPFTDLSGTPDPAGDVRRYLSSMLDRRYDLAAAPPIRFDLFRLGPDRHVLMRTSHHLISDAPSWNVFLRELGEAYEAFLTGATPALPPVRFQYADFSAWQRATWDVNGAKYRNTVAWWKKQVTEAAVEDELPWRLPIMRSRPATDDRRSEGALSWSLDGETCRRLDELAAGTSATYYAVRLATLVPVLSELTSRATVMLRAYFTRRDRKEFDGTFGLLVDGTPVFFRNDPQATFRELVEEVSRRLGETSVYADMPYHLLEEALAEDNLQLPRVPFLAHMPTQTPAIRAAGLEMKPEMGVRYSRNGVQFWFDQVREQSDGSVAYFDARIYDPEAIAALVARLVRFSATAAGAPDDTVAGSMERSR